MSLKIESVAVTDLKPYANNPRKGNVKVIAESLKTYGQYKPITVNSRTREILAGNHTFQAAVELGWETIDVTFVDVDEETAGKIVAIDNRSSDLGEYDNEKLLELLSSIPDLDGSGYEQTDLDDLRALLEESVAPTVSSYSEVKTGETGQSGTLTIPSLEEYAERYAQKATRMLIADYPNATYIWLMEKLLDYRNKNNITSNADAIVHLLETEYKEQAPSETE
jgi:hypothetical protein